MSSVIKTNTISEVISANGVTIDGVSLKDGQVPASAGSSLVLLKSGTPSGADTGTTYDDFYSSDYDVYLVTANTLRSTADNTDMSFKLIDSSGSVLATSNYDYNIVGRTSAGAAWGWSAEGGSGGFALNPYNLGNAGGESLSFTMWMYGFSNTDADTTYNGTLGFGHKDNDDLVTATIGGRFTTEATVMRGLKFFLTGSGGFRGTGTIQIYGLIN